MATFATFVAAIQALTVTGVTTHFDEPPKKLHTAQLPAAYPLMPSGSLGEKIISCYGDNKTRSMLFVIAIEPVGQGTQAQNYPRIATLADALETALDGLEKSQGGTLANFIEYDIDTNTDVIVGTTPYWAIIAEVSARDV